MRDTSDDAQLMARVMAGDDRACTALFRRHHERAVAEARSRTRNADAAEDAAAAAF